MKSTPQTSSKRYYKPECHDNWYSPMCVWYQRNFETFKSVFFIQLQQKPIWRYQWRSMVTTELPVPSFSVDFMWITTKSESSCELAWSIYIHGNKTGPEKRLARIGYFKTFVYEFKNVFLMVHDTPVGHLRNATWKYPKLNQNGVINISSWYKLRLTFTAWRL